MKILGEFPVRDREGKWSLRTERDRVFKEKEPCVRTRGRGTVTGVGPSRVTRKSDTSVRNPVGRGGVSSRGRTERRE